MNESGPYQGLFIGQESFIRITDRGYKLNFDIMLTAGAINVS